MMDVRPISLREASAFVGRLHRHHGEPRGCKFAIGAEKKGALVGVVIAGRPVARMLDDGRTCEVTRLCTDGTLNACSLLYSAAAACARAQGYRRIVTYILASETGDSLRAAGWVCEGQAGGGSWSRERRERDDRHPLERKTRWSRELPPKRSRRIGLPRDVFELIG